jgi:hypothetical protein
MPILQFVGVLLLVGVLLWGVNVFPYCDAGIKKLIQIVVVIVAAIWVIQLFFPISSITSMHVGK